MIVSRAHGFIFFHNPKAGGTSVRATIERFNDIGFGLWGTDPAQTGGRRVDRAHLGVDEFAAFYPDLWAAARGGRLFCLYRDPAQRFLSSVSEHSKLHGATDIRFCSEARRTRILFDMIDRLAALGTAESAAVMGAYELTHFRPQWIYGHSADPAVTVEAFPVARMDDVLAHALVAKPVPIVWDEAKAAAAAKPVAAEDDASLALTAH